MRSNPFSLVLIAVLGGSVSLHAQSSVEVNAAGLQFNLLNPGARSLGVGGAFTGLADDATASYANPAGLINMSLPEVSMEGRRWDYSNSYTAGGHVFGSPSGNGVDRVPGIVEGTSRNVVNGLSFLSFVYPQSRWAVAAYRHELGNFRSSPVTQGAFVGPQRLFPTMSSLSLRVDSYGGAFSYRVTDTVAAGLSVARYDFTLVSLTNRYNASLLNDAKPGDFYGPADYNPSKVFNKQKQFGHDWAVAWNAGVLWTPSHRFSVGAVYKKGSQFDVLVQSIAGPVGDHPGHFEFDEVGQFHIPVSYGIGAAFRPTEVTMISFDVDRINYSALVRNFLALSGQRDLYKANDGTEFHAGFEYVLTRTRYPIVFRVGAWTDPDHRIRYMDSSDLQSALQSALFRSSGVDRHYAGGMGIAVGKYYQIDFAADHSKRQQLASISMVTRF